MKILAIETAMDSCGVALSEGLQLVAECRIQQKNVHNEKLVSTIEWLLAEAGWQIEDLQGLAVSIGPGSFTGLRIGIAVCKGLAFSAGLPLVTVNTLDAMAHEARFWRGKLCAVIKARADEVYFALYEKSLNLTTRISDYQISDWETLIRSTAEGTLMMASPAELTSALTRSGLVVPTAGYPVLSALVVAQLGHQKFVQNEFVDVESIEPFYLKDFQPKRKVYNHALAVSN